MDSNMEGISSTIDMFKHVNMYLSKEKNQFKHAKNQTC